MKLIYAIIVTVGSLVVSCARPGTDAQLSETPATLPRLVSYVETTTFRTIYVAIADNAALSLEGCDQASKARELFGIDSTVLPEPALETDLVATYGLKTHPSIGCDGTAAQQAIPITQPIWADFHETMTHYLEFPLGSGRFYGVPFECDPLKCAFMISERLLDPRQIAGETRPPAALIQHLTMLTCRGTGGVPPAPPPTTRTILYTGEIELAPFVWGAIYVAMQEHGTVPGSRVVLPIYRINGNYIYDISDGAVPGLTLGAVEDDLKARFGVTTIVSLPGAFESEMVGKPMLDYCVSNCASRTPLHRVYVGPSAGATDFTAPTSFATGVLGLALDGTDQTLWTYAGSTTIAFSQCDDLVKNLGLKPSDTATTLPWETVAEQAIARNAATLPTFQCMRAEAAICRRSVERGTPLTAADFAATGPCASKAELIVTLPRTVIVTQPITIDGGFDTVRIVGNDTTISLKGAAAWTASPLWSSACLHDARPTFLNVLKVNRTVLSSLQISQEGNDAPLAANFLAIHGEKSRLVLDGVQIFPAATSNGEGIRLCQADLITQGLTIKATGNAIQAGASRLLVVGSDQRPSMTTSENEAFALSMQSHAYLHEHTATAKTRAVALRDATFVGNRVSLTNPTPPHGEAFSLRYGAKVDLKFSRVSGFDYVAVYRSNGNDVRLVLPLNDIGATNNHLFAFKGSTNQFTWIH